MASRVPLTPDEERRVLAALLILSPRDHCLVALAINTGFRASELGAVLVGDVWTGSTSRSELVVERRHLKNGRGLRRESIRSRCVPLNAAAQAAIEYFVISCPELSRDQPLFRSQRGGRGLRRWQMNRIVRRAARAAGISEVSRIGTHSLRKTFARKIYEASGHDIDLTRMALGHAHVSTTQAYLVSNPLHLNSIIRALAA
jgi:integrase